MLTAVFEIQVQETLVGDESTQLYAEHWRAPVAEIQAFKDALPEDAFVFIVREAYWDEVLNKYENVGMGVPEGATLRAFDYPFGIIAQGATSLEYPLMSDKAEEVFASTTLDELIREIGVLGETALR